MLFKKVKNWFSDLVFPKRCFGCNKIGVYICAECLKTIPINQNLTCPICNQLLATSNRNHQYCQSNLNGLIISSNWHNNLLKELIHAFKYEFIKELCDPLAEIMVTCLRRNLFIKKLKDHPVLIPIPLHYSRLRWRSFNQSETLARRIAQEFHWLIEDNLLIRQKHTKPQMSLDNIDKRWQNTEKAFSLNSSLENTSLNLSNRTIFLLDDVCTSGATIESAAHCLRMSYKHSKIYGLALARA